MIELKGKNIGRLKKPFLIKTFYLKILPWFMWCDGVERKITQCQQAHCAGKKTPQLRIYINKVQLTINQTNSKKSTKIRKT